MSDEINKLQSELTLVLDILNQLEVYEIIPSEIVERSKNRIRLKNLKEQQKESPSKELENKIRTCYNRELDLHKLLEIKMKKI